MSIGQEKTAVEEEEASAHFTALQLIECKKKKISSHPFVTPFSHFLFLPIKLEFSSSSRDERETNRWQNSRNDDGGSELQQQQKKKKKMDMASNYSNQ